MQDVVDLVERSCDLDRAAGGHRRGDHAEVVPVDMLVLELRASRSLRDADRRRVDRQREVLVAWAWPAARANELHASLGAAEARLVAVRGLAGDRDAERLGALGHLLDGAGTVAERRVDLAAKLCPHRHVGADGRKRDRDRDSRRGGERQAAPDRHAGGPTAL